MNCVRIDFRDILCTKLTRYTRSQLQLFFLIFVPTFEARKKMKVSGNLWTKIKFAYHGKNFKKVNFTAVRVASKLGLARLKQMPNLALNWSIFMAVRQNLPQSLRNHTVTVICACGTKDAFLQLCLCTILFIDYLLNFIVLGYIQES